MSWSVSTWVCAGTLSRSTPDPSNGVAPTTSTGGRVKGSPASVGAVSCAAATADSKSNVKAAPGETCLRSAILPPVHVPRRNPLRPRTCPDAFPIYLANFPDIRRKTSLANAVCSDVAPWHFMQAGDQMGDWEPDVAAVPPDRPGLHRPRGQPRAGRADGLGQCLALGAHRDAFGLAGRPANDRESDRSAAECSRPVTQSGRPGGLVRGQPSSSRPLRRGGGSGRGP